MAETPLVSNTRASVNDPRIAPALSNAETMEKAFPTLFSSTDSAIKAELAPEDRPVIPHKNIVATKMSSKAENSEKYREPIKTLPQEHRMMSKP